MALCHWFWSFLVLMLGEFLCSAKFQGVHVLDPRIEDFKYYESWNSNQWIKWLRQRYISDIAERRNGTLIGSLDDATRGNRNRLYGTWANIIIISNKNEIESAFSNDSTSAYTDLDRADYFWSDVPFTVFVILRGPKGNGTSFTVHNCSNKKMFINAKLDVNTFKPMELQTFFPKKVKNPGENLRVPLSVCRKVSLVRSLLDEISFSFRKKEKIDSNEET